jgi:hypothetical protein
MGGETSQDPAAHRPLNNRSLSSSAMPCPSIGGSRTRARGSRPNPPLRSSLLDKTDLGGLPSARTRTSSLRGIRATAVILITHSGDRDLVSVSQMLASRDVPNLLWFFDIRDDELVVDAGPGFFELRRDADVLCSEALERASAIVYRTRLGRSTRLVTSTRGTFEERQFADREWSSLLNGLLLEAEYRYKCPTWINRPSAGLLAANKFQLIATADLDGLHVPPWRVSTDALLPGSPDGQFVCKAINEDERIDDQRMFSTSVLDHEVVARSPFRTDCPSFIQERVDTQYELRVYHFLGQVLCVKVRSDAPYADIRLVPKGSLEVEQVGIQADVAEAIRGYCERRQLSYCVFDFLCTLDQRCFLVDVTPSGGWSYLERPDDPFITRWYVDTLCRLCLNVAGASTAVK